MSLLSIIDTVLVYSDGFGIHSWYRDVPVYKKDSKFKTNGEIFKTLRKARRSIDQKKDGPLFPENTHNLMFSRLSDNRKE